MKPNAVAQAVGNPGTREVEAAQALARSLPEEILVNLEGPGRAVGLLLALVLDPKPEVQTLQLALITRAARRAGAHFDRAGEDAARRLCADSAPAGAADAVPGVAAAAPRRIASALSMGSIA